MTKHLNLCPPLTLPGLSVGLQSSIKGRGDRTATLNVLVSARINMSLLLRSLLALLAVNWVCGQTQQQFQRLFWPANNAEFKIIPHIEMPMTMAPSVQSGMNFKMPITLKFPTMRDLMGPSRAGESGDASAGPKDASTPREEDMAHKNLSRANSRAMFYRSVESGHPTLGKSCLLRAICEVAEVPVINSGSGLLGELIDLLLT